ncbi:MAG: sugar porter family MFS transporter [Prolixibacteraceae bacterium]|jgi:SP family arabinose:H+ symporter-like MFS transporter|nr:sugar porter family MFS transporter [Prolixibacteraceae bacterium]
MKGYVVLISVVAALGGLLFGFDTAVISGTINFIQPYFGLSETGLGWTVSSLLFGCIGGVFLAGKAGDHYGRKKVLMMAALLFLVSAVGSASAHTLIFFLVARILGGLAVGVASILSPMYIAELAPAKYRGTLVSLNQLAIVIGILVAFFSNYVLVGTGENNWRWMLLVMAAPAVLLFFSLFLVPESPRWLVARGKDNEALQVLIKTSGKEFAAAELKAIEKTLNVQEESRFSELLEPKVKPLLYIGIVLAVFQQITGINTIMYYAPKIFANVGQSNNSALLQTILIGGTNLVFTLVAMALIDRFGRKMLIQIGSTGMMLMLAGLSVLYFMNLTSGVLVLTFILGYIAFFAASLGPATWVVATELFPNRLRSKGMSIAIVSLWMACTVVTIAFPIMLEKLSGGITFLIFALICLANLLYVLKYVPETKGKTLEELEKEFSETEIK